MVMMVAIAVLDDYSIEISTVHAHVPMRMNGEQKINLLPSYDTDIIA